VIFYPYKFPCFLFYLLCSINFEYLNYFCFSG